MRNYFTFNGIDSRDFGVYINGTDVFSAPARDIERIAVPGRNGELTIDRGRFENIEVPYDAFIVRGFRSNVAALRNALCSVAGYGRLEDTYHPDEFRMGRFVEGLNVTASETLREGTFRITFDCMPQRFLKSGALERKQGVYHSQPEKVRTLVNPTPFPTKPIIRFTTRSDSSRITVNGIELSWRNIGVPSGGELDLWFDCETEIARYGDETGDTINEYIYGTFPTLVPGANVFSGNESVLYITPRWYVI